MLFLFKAFSHLKTITIYQNIKPLSFPNSAPEKCGPTLQSQTTLSMFRVCIFLKTEDCQGGLP